MERNRRFIIGATIIVLPLAYLVYTGIRETSVYYLTIEVPDSPRSGPASLRIAGGWRSEHRNGTRRRST
jgi:hypothetical protein